MVEQTTNEVVEYLRNWADIALPDLGGDGEPIASSLEDLADILGATEIDPLTLKPVEDEPETPGSPEIQPEVETLDPLEPVEPEDDSPNPLEDTAEPMASPQIEQKKDE